jgi:methyltransferase (TIGR00027 family)
MYEYMLARTAFFDHVFRDALSNNIPQIVLLGAGYDTRAYRFATLNTTTKILELDIATTQQRKKKCLKKAQIDIPRHARLVPINFTTESLHHVLENAGYKHHEQTLFIWEGVSYYLEPDSVDATLAFVKNSSHHDSIIAFDYVISISEEQMNTYYGVKEFVQTWLKHRSNDPFRFTIDEGTIESFLAQRGLRGVNHLDNREIENTFLFHDNGSLLGQINGAFRFALASRNTIPQKKQGT